MAWTPPMTAVAGNVYTAAQFNTNVRDNLLETCVPTVGAAGSMAIADAANSMGTEVTHPGAAGYHLVTSSATGMAWRNARNFATGDANYVGVGTSDNSYLYFSAAGWGSGTGVSATVTTDTQALVFYGCNRADPANVAGHSISLSFDVGGASSITVSDDRRAFLFTGGGTPEMSLSRVHLVTGLTAGSNTFRLLAKASDISVAEIGRPWIGVLPV